MMDFILKNGWNLVLRGLSIGGKFLIAVFIAKYLTLQDLGVYGIITVSISLSVFLLGLDFYTFSMRNLLQVPMEKRGAMLRDQFVFYLLTYSIFLPPLYILFYLKVISSQYIIAFYGILILEHLSQEFYRLYIFFARPVTANIILFFRSGFWVYFIILAWIFNWGELRNLESVITFWFAGALISVLISFLLLFQFKLGFLSLKPIDWAYIKKGFFISLPFFAGTVAYKIVEFSDRYLIDFWEGEKLVGIYTFYAGIGNLVEVVVQTTVIVIFSPMLIESFNKNSSAFNKVFLNFKKQIIGVTFIVLFCVSIAIFPIIHYLQKPEFSDNISIFFWLAVSKVMFNLSLIYHYQLYVRNKDNYIMWSTLAGAASNLILNFILIPAFSILGAAIATFLSFGIIYVAKFYFYNRLNIVKYEELKN